MGHVPQAPRKPVVHKNRHWALITIQTRNVADKLNELSAAGYTIFTVNQSVSVGGSYEVLYYIDKAGE